MIDPSLTESGVGTVLVGVIFGLMRNMRLEQSRSRRVWEHRIETDVAHIEKITEALRKELDYERTQRAELTDKMISAMAAMTENKDVMNKLSRAFSSYVESSNRRVVALEHGQSEVIELGKTLRLIRTKKAG